MRWKKCPKCQARIKALKLRKDAKHTAEEKLQSFIISHAENFLNNHGRQIIGWDEILEGGLAPNATVMSWRGTAGGIEAAKLKHDVIMTPNTGLKIGTNVRFHIIQVFGKVIAFHLIDIQHRRNTGYKIIIVFAVIDLGVPTEITTVSMNTCVEKGDWVFDARGMMVEVSEDGTTYKKVASEDYPAMKATDRNGVYTHTQTSGFVIAVPLQSIHQYTCSVKLVGLVNRLKHCNRLRGRFGELHLFRSHPAMKATDRNGVYTHTQTFDPVKARFVKVTALSEDKIPGRRCKCPHRENHRENRSFLPKFRIINPAQ